MKNFRFPAIIVLLSILSMSHLQAQFSMVYSMGISPQQSPEGHYIFVNRSSPKAEFTFNLAQVKASYFIGAGAKYTIAPFFFMAEAQYNKREYIYDVETTYPVFGRSQQIEQYSETMNVINVPVTMGVDLGFMEVTSGFLPQVIVSQQTDLEAISGYSEKLSPVRFGWHSGVAAKLSNFRIGLNWQMDFDNYADHIYVNNESLALQGRSGRLVGLLSCAF